MTAAITKKAAAKRAPAKKTTVATVAAAPTPTSPPLIGAYWPGQGGIYLGQGIAHRDLAQGHVVLSTVKIGRDRDWKGCNKWAESLDVDGHTDFRLATLREGWLIAAHGREHVDLTRYHWLGEEYEGDASYAWDCGFDNGSADYLLKSYERQAVVVRRFNI